MSGLGLYDRQRQVSRASMLATLAQLTSHKVDLDRLAQVVGLIGEGAVELEAITTAAEALQTALQGLDRADELLHQEQATQSRERYVVANGARHDVPVKTCPCDRGMGEFCKECR